jgi:hypothetical protein
VLFGVCGDRVARFDCRIRGTATNLDALITTAVRQRWRRGQRRARRGRTPPTASSTRPTVERIDGGLSLLDSPVGNLVSAMASFAPPSAGQTTLPQTYQDALAGVIAAN